jgi:hypothetical protein
VKGLLFFDQALDVLEDAPVGLALAHGTSCVRPGGNDDLRRTAF